MHPIRLAYQVAVTISVTNQLPALGSLSSIYESNGDPGTVSTGEGDHGGVSYGAYQLASNEGQPARFLGSDGVRWAAEFAGQRPGSAKFSVTWRRIAIREPRNFLAAQHEYIGRTHYQPLVNRVIRDTGVDVTQHSRALQNVVWSTGVQHGAVTRLITQAVQTVKASGLVPQDSGFDAAVIREVYALRGCTLDDGSLALFQSSSPKVQAGVIRRYNLELNQALSELAAE